MTGSILKLRTALQDLDEISDLIRQRTGPDSAVRFLLQADATLN